MAQTRIYRKRGLYLVLIMTCVAISVAASTLSILYNAAFEQQRGRLEETARSNARLMEAMARFDREYSLYDLPGGAYAATFRQIRDAHGNFRGFGETGEFTLARREGDRVEFLLRHRHYDLDRPKPVAFSSHLAEPMRAAVAGQSGTMVGIDYRGVRVLAAFEPVAELDVGIVAKIDLAEVRAPFVRAGYVAAGIGLGFVVIGTLLFLRIGNPLIRKLEESEEKYRALFEQGVDAVLMIDPDSGRILEFNERAYRNLGYNREEFRGLDLADIDATETRADVAQRIEKILREGVDLFMTKHRTKSGEIRDILVANKLIRLGGRRFIQGIWQDITKRVQAEERLRSSLQEKEVLLREIHHRVKNNMQVIYSLLSVQARHAVDPRLAAALSESQQRVQTMALVHENLYRSDDIARIDTATFIDALVCNLRNLYAADRNRISLRTEVDDVELNLDQAAPVGLIVNELVSNIFKHAFPGEQEGNALVTLKKHGEDRMELVVSDDGIGIPKEMDLEHIDSLGLELITALSDQLRAELHLEREFGTRVRIIFTRKSA